MSTKSEMETGFKEAYSLLNKAQKQAVDTIEGPVMVIAGPGTGKTQILTLRIANILKQTDAKANAVLALTFTESGARAMRDRLKSLIGEAAYDVGIYTFHGFADYLITQYPEAYPTVIGGRPASEIEKVQIIEAILTDTTFKAVRPSGDPSFYVKPLLKAIQTLKQEYLEVDHFAALVSKQEQTLLEVEQFHTKGAHKGKERGEYKDAVKSLTRNQELLAVYRLYESSLRDAKLYDFDDMIVQTVRALSENEDMLRDLQERFQYVLADEHQDVNGSQNKILELLVNFHDSPNLFVVGDEKQAIYRFQGASLDNFLYFDTNFGNSTSISLTDNYRSGQAILDTSQSIIETDDETLAKLRVPLNAKLVPKSLVQKVSFVHQVIEDNWLISDIKHTIESGVSPGEIVVIVRTNKEVEEYATSLRKAGINAEPSADSDILSHPITTRIIKLVRAVVSPTSEATMVELLHEPYWNIPVRDIATLLQNTNRNSPMVHLLRDGEKLAALELENIDSVTKISACIDSVRAESVTLAAHRLLEKLLDESGFIASVIKSDPFEGTRIVRRLFDEVESMVLRKEVTTLAGVVRQLDLHTQYGLALNAPFIPFGQEAVQVMTAHKSKGLEFEVVYIPHLVDRTWGKKISRDLFKLPIVKHDVGDMDVSEDDERRLFYVAMTRAKKRLVLSYSDENIEGKEQTISRFLHEVDEQLLTDVETDTFSKQFSPVASLKAVPAHPITTELILEALSKRGFSPTALNNYLKSPWEYFYRNVLRVPQIKSTELQFGTAIHAVLDRYVYQAIRGEEMTLGAVSELLKQVLNKEALSDEEFVRMHERGLEALSVYIDHLATQVGKNSATELRLEAELETGIEEYPLLKLNGTLDRIDSAGDKIIKVVDYKTGKPKTRGFIEGTTAASTGDYKRQLVFYALLLSLQEDTNKHCRTGVLSFVEPDSHNQIKEESFTITDEEIEELKQELIRVTKEVVSGESLRVACDPKVCHYCDLVEVWQNA